MKWTDSQEIAIALADEHPDVDPKRVNFVDLRNWVARPRRLRRRPQALGREDPRGHPGGLDRGGRLSDEPIRVDFGRLRYFIAMAFECVGMPAADAQVVAALMAEADLRGSDGHGVIRLPQYLQAHPRRRREPASRHPRREGARGHGAGATATTAWATW